ncbi:MAG: dihydrofolate reductase [Oligoflexia bacterium]|nr:dihydrofolate reductase [Oligoflexia bacterium]
MPSSPQILAIAAMDQARVIGFRNALPWRIPEDMQRFKELTVGQAVLMGRKTFDSLPAKFKPLPDRLNIVASRSATSVPGHPEVQVWHAACAELQKFKAGALDLGVAQLWVIGGSEIYGQTMPLWDELYLTLVHSKHQGDAFFPEFETQFRLDSEERHEGFSFQHYVHSSPARP